MEIRKRLGWKPGLPQPKQFLYSPARGLLGLPPSTDLQSLCPPVYDQGDLGSCTANAAAGLSQFLMKKLGHKVWTPSRLAIYYWERVIEDTVFEDSGASLTDAMKVLTQTGSPHENLWWYNVKKFTVKPNKNIVVDANAHKIKAGISVMQDLQHLKACLAEGYPFIFGFSVYSSFESQTVATTGIMPMPKSNEELLGGHAVMAVGYDDNKQMFKIRNSWGAGWGVGGYFWMPYAFITDRNFADDFWTANAFATWS